MVTSTTIDNLMFGDLPVSVLTEIYSDGRHSSRLMEYHFAAILGGEVMSGNSEYDISSPSGKIECKAFTKNGADVRPSMHKGDKGLSTTIRRIQGKGAYDSHRKNLLDDLYNRAKDITYLIYDLTRFPIVDYVLIPGEEFLARFPSGKVSGRRREDLFK